MLLLVLLFFAGNNQMVFTYIFYMCRYYPLKWEVYNWLLYYFGTVDGEETSERTDDL